MDIYFIKFNEIYGRYLSASRDIKAGEIIFKEKPIVIGPKINSDLSCTNCYSELLKKFYVCTKCKLAPLCGPSCENQQGGHSIIECQLFSTISNELPLSQLIGAFHIVTILRCLSLRNKDSTEDWKALMNLEDHRGKRKGTSIWELHQVTSKMVQNLNLLNSDDLKEDIIQKICGILDVNSFELRVANNDPRVSGIDSICGIYPTAALMAHSCVANTHLAVDDFYIMTVRASVSIEKGSAILFNYTNALQNTMNRKEHLREGKYFECSCNRCIDATELGTHMSSLKCTNCANGMITMKIPHSVPQYSSSDSWYCNSCGKEMSGNNVKLVMDSILKLENNLDKTDIKKVDSFISEASRQLPPFHSILVDAKQQLAGLLRDHLNNSISVSKKSISRKLELCKEFLPLLEILEPGISRLKAVTLYEVYFPLVQISNKEYEGREISSNVLLTRLEEAEKYLKESIKYLLFEPNPSSEATLCKRAMGELRDLKKSIESIKGIIEEEKQNKNHRRAKRI